MGTQRKRWGKKVFFVIVIVFVLMYALVLYIQNTPNVRYYFDITFNITKTHKAYETGTIYMLPLPPKTAIWSRDTDISSTYVTKREMQEFIDWYSKNGYNVQDNRIMISDREYYTIKYLGVVEGHKDRYLVRIKRYKW